MNCTATEACEKPARSKRKGLCRMHENRQAKGIEPRLPVAPLAAYVSRHADDDGVTASALAGTLGQQTVSVSLADRIAVETFGVHPFEIYGNEWFNAA